MRDRLEVRGEWWLPEAAQYRWPGRLVYEPAEGVRLHLTIGRESESRPLLEAATDLPLVHGETVKGDAVTLTEAMVTQSNATVGAGFEATLHPTRTFIGAWFAPDEEIAFRRLRFQVEGLDEWVHRKVVDIKDDSPGEYTVRYEHPKPEQVAVASNVEVELAFTAAREPQTTGLHIRRAAWLELLSDEPVPYTTLERLVRQVRNFFIYVTRERVALLAMRADVEDEETHRVHEVEILYRPEAVIEARRHPPEPRRMLFTLAKNGHGDTSRLTRWLDLQAEFEVVFNLYLVGLYQPRIFLEFRFLSLAQAAESFHSRRFDAKKLPTDEHQQRVDDVVDAAPERLKGWARKALQDANRKSYRGQLAELIEALPPVIRAAIAEPEELTGKLRWTRNVFTHWSRKDEAKAPHGGELMGLTWVLRAILEALFLLELGFTTEEADALLERNEDYKRDLSFGLINWKRPEAEDSAAESL